MHVVSEEEVVLFKRGRTSIKSKTGKFVGWCAACGVMMMKQDRGTCAACGGKEKTKVRPEMKDTGERVTRWSI